MTASKKSKFDNEFDFSCEYSENLPAIFKSLNISLAFTSYQAQRLMLVRSDGAELDINFKHYQRPMGLTVSDEGLTLGIFTQIVNFQRQDQLLPQLKQPLASIESDITAPTLHNPQPNKASKKKQPRRPKKLTKQQKQSLKQKQAYTQKLYNAVDDRVDACFITRSAHYSGMINIHDIDWGDDGLWVVNSSFSCLCTVEPDYSFIPRWKPHFISDLAPEDRCHLNGMTLKDGKPAYVTTFSTANRAGDWRNSDRNTGTLMCVQSNQILVDGLHMPHSPRYYQGYVYYCNSGLGQICRYHPETKQSEVIAEVPGFTRGVDFYGTLMIVGLSKVRQSDVTAPAPLGKKYDETFSGLWIFNLDETDESNKIKQVGCISFSGNVDQIYDVAVLPNCSFPELIEASHPRMRNHFTFPNLEDIA
ncbi:TIGR03032 family protein [Paraferrimonas sp. SM1919]|uniref:TIGR03032 family protein n=1 Tax=Paraferrimonas sp. SM1919 TaxID=2662263 RepID=UPI0013D29193|nr:TIGR03032 family protein [Paraferrimonas sp. SM1919]